jgi:hypothetical protein
LTVPGYIVTTASVIRCPHGGVVQLIDTADGVAVDGKPAVFADAIDGISGCPVQPSCTRMVWTPDEGVLRLDGRPLLTTATAGACESGYGDANGEPQFVTNQLRVEA